MSEYAHEDDVFGESQAVIPEEQEVGHSAGPISSEVIERIRKWRLESLGRGGLSDLRKRMQEKFTGEKDKEEK